MNKNKSAGTLQEGTEYGLPTQSSGKGASTALAEMLKRQRTKPAPPAAPPLDNEIGQDGN